ncbi:winged helix family two component transcriptional regulator [Orenia metallireducens]|jgi:phosphate regulon transcriptional regulator PhoB|uniref:Stage 0 sporulation protein A homolog n=1 Tax=Orenia metallireducens TaxID=1413210 RepID=A0A285HRE8_9FIRM|nr:response regulator transcription factor [Orenia metallireducens]PRX25111.1 winged helix family two component transcriptional regulator [Orenia metallireducens]SNY38254.1 two component transcriptional regulator, winged helix family [Orenia metallireducens]
MSNKILVVDDEENIVELVKFNLEKDGYQVTTAYDGEEALKKVEEVHPNLVVLDLMLPKLDGFDVCRQIRKDSKLSKIPIIMLSAKGEEIDKILGLELGADDYVTKPFSPRELLARVKAILRRVKKKSEKEEEIIALGDIKVDLTKYRVEVDGSEISLTPKEFDLLAVLMTHPGQVFSRSYLLDELWGYDYHGDTRTVDVHIRRLRKKISNHSDKESILTVRGVGYKFKEIKS